VVALAVAVQYAVSRRQVARRRVSATLAMEVAPFGSDPPGAGGIRTNRARRAVRMRRTFCRKYEASVGSIPSYCKASKGVRKSSRGNRGRNRTTAKSTKWPVRLPSVSDAEKSGAASKNLRAPPRPNKWRHLTVSTVFFEMALRQPLVLAKSGINS